MSSQVRSSLNLDIRISVQIGTESQVRRTSSSIVPSAHPARTNRAINGDMFKSAAKVCSGSGEKHDSLGLATTIPISSGYVPGRLHSWRRSNQSERGTPTQKAKSSFACRFSDEVSRATRLCLRRTDLEDLVTVVEIPPKNQRYQLVRNRIYDRLFTTPNCVICTFRGEGDSMKSCAVYMIKCTNCGREYTAETALPLCVRVKEHLEGLSSSPTSIPLGCYQMQVDNGVDYEVETTDLELETEISARRSLEVFWIHVKNPKMYREEECPSITNEIPYLRLCNI